jgi:hypothetical protein
MATRILGPTGSRRRRRFLFVPILVIAAAALLLVGAAQAVHDENFQLDGDVLASTTTNYGNPPHTQQFDWDSFFNAAGQKSPVLPDASRPGFTSSGFDRDFNLNADGSYNTSDQTTYTQGSKDIDNVGAWVCTSANNVTNKGDIQNDYAVAYTDPVSGDKFVYFALERNSNNGDANVAFWFLQDRTANCSAANGTTSWTGNHTDGDLFIVSSFTKGGVVSTINAFRWNGGANGSLGTTAIASGGDCTATNPAAPLGDKACATANKASITTPWLTNNNGSNTGLGHTLLTGEFFEGGVNLTQSGLGGKCFNTFVGDTRSSQSFTATLYDFARGSLGGCITNLSTQENKATPSSIGTGVVSSGTDTATLTITGASTWGGTLTWYLCGPIPTGACDSHGVQVTSRTVSNSSPSTDFVSGTANLTSVGRYCWHAHFQPDSASADAGVQPGDDDGSNECFTITPVTPTLTTSATCSASPCVLGSTLNDTATLSGTASGPGNNGAGGDTGLYKSINATNGQPADNSISWTLYGPAADGSAQCTTAIANAPTPSSVTVSGDATYGPVMYTTSASDRLGTYTFAASYPGQSPNTNAASDVACANGATNGEQVTVTSQATTSTTQKWLPQDSAHVTASGGATVAGFVVFQLFESTDCSGPAVQTFGGDPAARITVDASGNATTNNTTYYVDTNVQISWRATFHSTNGVASGAPAPCERSDIANLNDNAGP